jgi:hypothetical protein
LGSYSGSPLIGTGNVAYTGSRNPNTDLQRVQDVESEDIIRSEEKIYFSRFGSKTQTINLNKVKKQFLTNK